MRGDFNDDASLTDVDIDLLSVAVHEGSNNAIFDLNNDSDVDDSDRTIWVEEVFGTFFGDADLNKKVEFADFLTLSSNFGLDGGWAKGDFDGNGRALFPDFLLLAGNFGKSATAVTVVPEPGAGLMLIVVACLVGRLSMCQKRVGDETCQQF